MDQPIFIDIVLTLNGIKVIGTEKLTEQQGATVTEHIKRQESWGKVRLGKRFFIPNRVQDL